MSVRLLFLMCHNRTTYERPFITGERHRLSHRDRLGRVCVSEIKKRQVRVSCFEKHPSDILYTSHHSDLRVGTIRKEEL